jgi:hypothetical protein
MAHAAGSALYAQRAGDRGAARRHADLTEAERVFYAARTVPSVP